jgi:hypothetical protein
MIIGIQNLKKKVESMDTNSVRNCKLAEHYTAAIDLCQSDLIGDSQSLQQLHQKYHSNPIVVLMPMELNIVMNPPRYPKLDMLSKSFRTPWIKPVPSHIIKLLLIFPCIVISTWKLALARQCK